LAAVEISLPDTEHQHGGVDRRIFVRPIEPPAGQQPDLAAVESGVNAIAIELDFVQPVRPPPPASFTSLFNRGLIRSGRTASARAGPLPISPYRERGFIPAGHPPGALRAFSAS